MKKNLVFLWLTLFSYTMFGQSWTIYKKANGLAEDYVYSIVIDNQGHKWIACANNLTIIDGTKFSIVKTPNEFIALNSLLIDSKNNIWGSSNNGVVCYEGTNWKTYNSTAIGLSETAIFGSIAIDAKGNKWFGSDKGVSKFDGIKWKNYNTSNGLVNDEVNALVIDSKGLVWVGTSKGLSQFDGVKWKNYTTENGLSDNGITSLAIDLKGNLWVGTYGSGAFMFDGAKWIQYDTKEGLVDGKVKCIVCDKEGNLWFGTQNGVSKYNGNKWVSYNYKEKTATGAASGFGLNVNSIVIESQNMIWIGTPEGLYKLQEAKTSAQIPSTDNPSKNKIIVVCPDSASGKDALISSLSPDVNRGKTNMMNAISQTQQGNVNTCRSLIEFKIPNLPEGCVLDSAKLSLYLDKTSNLKHFGNNILYIQRIVSDWDDKTVTWSIQPKTVETNQVMIPEFTSETQDYNSMNVTRLVKDMMANKSESHGFMIKLQTEKPYRRAFFATCENSNKALHPKLVIYYSPEKK